MARFLGFIRRHDLVAFPLITFALGWLFYIPGALVIAGHPERYGWLVFFQTPGAAAALVAGLLVRYARGGRAEVRDGWRRYLDWRGHDWWWWLSAVMLIPLLAWAPLSCTGRTARGCSTCGVGSAGSRCCCCR